MKLYIVNEAILEHTEELHALSTERNGRWLTCWDLTSQAKSWHPSLLFLVELVIC